MSDGTHMSFGDPHVSQLVEKLEGYEPTELNVEKQTHRLFFVDSDVLSVYVNGQANSLLESWPSLFSLGNVPKPRNSDEVISSDKHLTNAIARTVSEFIFARFRESRSIQSHRLWLTPEHSRELDGIVHSVLAAQVEGLTDWQSSVIAHYEAISLLNESVSDRDLAGKKLLDLFDILVTNATKGRIARVYSVRRMFTRVPDRVAVFPSKAPGTAFMLNVDDLEFKTLVKKNAIKLLEIFLASLLDGMADEFKEPTRTIARLVFGFHRPTARQQQYIDYVLLNSDSLPANLAENSGWIETTTRRVTKQISDIYSLARLSATAFTLNERHSSGGKFTWEVCILSGSKLFTNLKQAASTTLDSQEAVRILHPLVTMRFGEFLRPSYDESPNTESEDLIGHNYALNVIATLGKNHEAIDSHRFLKALDELLTYRNAGFATQRDRSLARVRDEIRQFGDAKISNYLNVVRDLIGREFFTTYLQVNKLARDDRNKLSPISLPWLTLPFSPDVPGAAEKYMAAVHLAANSLDDDTVEARNERLDRLAKETFNDDPTGYTAMLCASVGYLRKGQIWIRAAETLANSALVIALEGATVSAASASYRPEGNEAFYLSAFVSRMNVSPRQNARESALEWRNTHRRQIDGARDKLVDWERNYPAVVSWPGSQSGFLRRIELVRYRYQAEDFARELFCTLIDHLEPVGNIELRLASIPTIKLLENVLSVLESLLAKCQEVHIRPGVAPELVFVVSQLFIAGAQAWLCLRRWPEMNRDDNWQFPDHAVKTLLRASDLLSADKDAESALALGLGKVLRKIVKRDYQNTKGVFKQFAKIDEIRVPFFESF